MDGGASAAAASILRAEPSRARRFCLLWLVMTAAFAALAGVFNVLADPYLVFGARRVAGLNAVKPEVETHTALAKDHLIGRLRPAGLLLGDSKVDIGLDPLSPAWPEDARPAFNDGVPGLGVEDVLARLRAAAGAGGVRRALVMLDLQNLAAPPDPPPETAVGGPASWTDRAGRARDLLLAALSLDALRASLATVAAQGRGDSVDMTPEGATGEGGFRSAASREGYDSLFVQKDAELVRRFARMDAALRGAPPGPPASARSRR